VLNRVNETRKIFKGFRPLTLCLKFYTWRQNAVSNDPLCQYDTH
jgi:hypothetical protein